MGVGDIRVTVRLFASLRERAGKERLRIEVPAATPVGAVWSLLPEDVRGPAPPAGIRYALNHVWAIPGAPLHDGDEVALVLPVSGG
jgi:molybdopterin synthase catalytic subunit